MENLKQRGNGTGPTSAVVAFNTRRLRKAAGLDLVGLSRRLTDIGRPISVAALSRLENNDRRVDVDDLVAIAIVLDVNTNALLFQPTLVGGHYLDLTGAAAIESSEVWQWARGESPLNPRPYPGDFAHRTDLTMQERQDLLREAWQAEAEKFRARVTPGYPTDPGPGVQHLVPAGGDGVESVKTVQMEELVRPDEHDDAG